MSGPITDAIASAAALQEGSRQEVGGGALGTVAQRSGLVPHGSSDLPVSEGDEPRRANSVCPRRDDATKNNGASAGAAGPSDRKWGLSDSAGPSEGHFSVFVLTMTEICPSRWLMNQTSDQYPQHTPDERPNKSAAPLQPDGEEAE